MAQGGVAGPRVLTVGVGWGVGILTCMRIDVPECSCEQGPDEEGTKGDTQYSGQEEAFACVTKEPAVVSVAAVLGLRPVPTLPCWPESQGLC